MLMRIAFSVWFTLLLAAGIFSPTQGAEASAKVRLHTELGDIVLEIDPAHSPISSANFLHYVDAGSYNGATFYRTVRLDPDNQPNNKIKIEVIQGGTEHNPKAAVSPPIPLERTRDTGLKHRDGTLSMARDGPDTATSEFFVCIGDQPELDYGGHRNSDGQGLAAFGRVMSGMDIVRRVHAAPAREQKLTPPIAIIKAERID